jgi:hypothetical protein
LQGGISEARIGSSFLRGIVRSSDDQPVDDFSGVLDAIGCDTAAMRVTQEEAGCLCEQSR